MIDGGNHEPRIGKCFRRVMIGSKPSRLSVRDDDQGKSVSHDRTTQYTGRPETRGASLPAPVAHMASTTAPVNTGPRLSAGTVMNWTPAAWTGAAARLCCCGKEAACEIRTYGFHSMRGCSRSGAKLGGSMAAEPSAIRRTRFGIISPPRSAHTGAMKHRRSTAADFAAHRASTWLRASVAGREADVLRGAGRRDDEGLVAEGRVAIARVALP